MQYIELIRHSTKSRSLWDDLWTHIILPCLRLLAVALTHSVVNLQILVIYRPYCRFCTERMQQSYIETPQYDRKTLIVWLGWIIFGRFPRMLNHHLLPSSVGYKRFPGPRLGDGKILHTLAYQMITPKWWNTWDQTSFKTKGGNSIWWVLCTNRRL